MRIFTIVIACIFIPGVLLSQRPINVINIVGQPEADKIAVSFTLGKGEFCYGAQLLRTTDTTDLRRLEKVGEITGVCGSQDFEASYTLFDESPYLNQPTFYRLMLGDFPSDFITVQLNEFGENGLSIYPNPADNYLQFFLDNQKQQPWHIEIFNLNGQFMFATPTSRNNPIDWKIPSSLNGVFIVKVYQENSLIASEKIVIQ